MIEWIWWKILLFMKCWLGMSVVDFCDYYENCYVLFCLKYSVGVVCYLCCYFDFQFYVESGCNDELFYDVIIELWFDNEEIWCVMVVYFFFIVFIGEVVVDECNLFDCVMMCMVIVVEYEIVMFG